MSQELPAKLHKPRKIGRFYIEPVTSDGRVPYYTETPILEPAVEMFVVEICHRVKELDLAMGIIGKRNLLLSRSSDCYGYRVQLTENRVIIKPTKEPPESNDTIEYRRLLEIIEKSLENLNYPPK